jgi:hypothetical protein
VCTCDQSNWRIYGYLPGRIESTLPNTKLTVKSFVLDK